MPENFRYGLMLIKTICWVDIILYIRLFGLRRVKFRLVRVGVGWVAGLIENLTNSAKLKLELELSLAMFCETIKELIVQRQKDRIRHTRKHII